MNQFLTAIYKADENYLGRLLSNISGSQGPEINDALRVVISDVSMLHARRLRFAEMLLMSGADPNAKQWNGEGSLLYNAAEANDPSIAQLLLLFACAVDNPTRAGEGQGETALHVAARNANALLVGLLLSSGASADYQTQQGLTPVMYSIVAAGEGQNPEGSYNEIIEALVVDSNLDLADREHSTALHYAVKYRNLAAMKILLDLGADVNCQDDQGFSPLMLAVQYPTFLEGATLLLDSGNCDVTIEAAPSQGRIRALDVLVEQRLDSASGSKHMESLVRKVLQLGADVDLRNDRASPTPLMRALAVGNVSAARVLIQANADLYQVMQPRGCQATRLSPTSPRTKTLFDICLDAEHLGLDRRLSLVGILIMSGCRPSRNNVLDIRYLLAQWDAKVGAEATNNSQLGAAVHALKSLMTGPQTLKSLCRETVRKTLKAGITDKLEQLDLPITIRSFLALSELDDFPAVH